MKKIFFSSAFLLLLLHFSPLNTLGQTWVEMMHDPNNNFYETVQEFEDYWSTHTIERGKGYKPFRRWQDFMEPRVFPKGDVKQAYRAKEEFQKYLDAHPEIALINRAPWMPLGPFGAPGGGGAGRINFVRIHPTNNNILYAGAPAGGLWISTNGGTSWTTNTDQLSVIGCTDIAIDPTNTQIMYLATGDGDAGDTYSIGILKSTDGGATWNPTGLTWAVTQGRTISRLLINPTNTQIVLAATSNGIYRTTDGGTSWVQERTGNFKDMEFKPGDPTTIYACGTTFWKSTDSGNNFSQITSGVPTNPGRLAIATTEANSAYVYLLACNNTNSGFLGVYRSTNSGTSFSTRSTSPNLLGWSSTGSDSGGQGWYDLAIAASPTNSEVVIVGGVNIWRSTNGGSSWSINGHWTGSGAPYVHADIHDLIFIPGSGTSYYSGNDGGVFRTTNSGGGWTDLSANMEIAQQYELGLSTSNASLLVTGHQDNGTNKMNGTTWTEIYGGDGMQCFVDRTNNNVIVASYVYGDFKRSTNGGANWSTITSGLTGNAAWEAPIHQDPVTASTYYCGYQNIFRSTNNGGTWSAIGSLTGTGTVVEFDVAPSNTQVIYALKSNAVFKTTNGGGSWTNITGTLPVASAALTYVEISPTDPNKVWVSFSGYSTGNKVFMSTNGGTSWTNYSTGLPNLPVNCIVYQTGSNDGLYIGTDVGVYYRDNTLSTWDPYFTGLPNVVVKDLEIYYATGKIRAATFGRGTWETDLYSPGNNAPVANFTADNTNVCVGSTVNFTDLSSYTPTSWSWDFGGGGTPNTSTAQNPSIIFNTPGTYTVTLTATNANGSDTEIKTNYITVSTPVSLPLVEGFENTTFPPAGWYVTDVNANGTWARTTAAGGFGSSSASALFDNYNVDEAGSRDELQTPKYDFTGYSSATMTFDVAYARYNATYSDSMAVMVSTDCGQTFTQVWAKGSTTLATAPDVTTAFVPTSSQWRTESVNMTPYVGMPNVLIVFQNRGHYGNMLYLDNVNITGVPAASLPTADFSGTPTTLCEGQTVTFTNLSVGSPTSYSWTFPGGTPASSTVANPIVTYNTAGTYDVTLVATNASGSDTETKLNYIVVNATPAANAGSNSPLCEGQTLNLTTSTVAGATYSWSGPGGYSSTSQNPIRTNVTTAMAGTYTVTVTANGCSNTSSVVVVINANPVANAASNSPVCSGNTINFSTTTVSGATYSWTGPNSFSSSLQNPSITNATTAASGSYSVTVAANGCNATSSTSVIVNQTPTANATSNSPVCEGQTINLSTPAVTGATYSWSGPGGYTSSVRTPSRTNATLVMGGTYTVTVTANGCSATSSVVVTVNASPAASAASNSPVCSGNSINLTTTTVSGATYAWTGPNAFSSSLQNPAITNATTAASGSYSVTVAANGCNATSSTSVIVNQTPTANATSNSPVCEGQTINLSTPAVTSATYSWSGPGGYNSTSQNPSRTNATLTMSGTYTVTVTANGCTATSSVVVSVNTSPAANPTSNSPVCSGNTINLSTTTVSGATYSWSGPNAFSSSLQNPSITNATTAMSGTYTLTVNNGCTATSSTTVTVNTSPSTTAGSNSPVCSGNAINLTATSVTGATYSWSGPGGFTSSLQNPSITNATTIMSGTYTVTVTANGCIGTSSVSVLVNQTPTANASSNSPVCVGQTINLTTNTISGATYSWSGPGGYSSSAQSPNRTNATTTMSGTYTVTVTANGCTATSSVSVTVNTLPAASASSNSPVCSGNTITLSTTNVSGAVYSWSGPGGYTSSVRNPSINNATTTMSGTYTVTVTGTNGCSSTSSVTVTVNQTPTAVAASNSPICAGQTLNLTTPTVVGATYSWSGPSGYSSTAQNPNRTNATTTMSGTYSVTVTANGCTATSSTSVVINAVPSVTASSNSPVCSGNTLNLNSTTVTGGVYSWSGPGGFTASTQNTSRPNSTTGMSGTYTVTVTANGCSASSSTTVTVNSSPTATASSNSPICAGQTLTLSTPAVTGASYSWSGPGGYTSSIRNPNRTNATTAMSGTYTVTVTVNGCSTTSSVNVMVNTSPSTTASSNSPVCSGSSINLTTTTVAGATYSWSGPNGFSSALQSPVILNSSSAMAGTYTVTVNNGCTASSTTSVTVNTSPAVIASASSSSVCAGNAVTLTGTGAASYSWNNSVVNGVPFVPSGTLNYTVTGTAANGCTDTDQITVTVNALPVVVANASSGDVCIGNSVILTGSGAATYNWDNSVQDGVGFVPGSTTTYTVTGTDANNCQNTDQVTVNVHALPVVSANASANPICEGSNVILNGSGAATYSWNNSVLDGVSFSPSSTTLYTVIGTDGFGCQNSAQITVTVNPLPNVAYTQVNDSVCHYLSNIQLDPGTPAGGVYSGPGVSPNGIFDAAFAGEGWHPITYTFTDSLGCSDSVVSTIYVKICKFIIDLDPISIGITEPENEFAITIIPNPTTGQFILTLPENLANDILVDIYNNIGQVVYSDQAPGKNNILNMDLTGFSRGVYFIRIRSGDLTSVEKLVIN